MERNEREVTPEIRRKALEILYSNRHDALRDVEKLLGVGESYVTLHEIAHRLGITYYRLKYLLQRDYLRQREKVERTEKKEAASMPGSVVVSQKLGFHIWLPAGWTVTSEDDDIEDASEGMQNWYDQWCKLSKKEKLKFAYQSFLERYPIVGVSFKEFAQSADERITEEDQRLQGEVRLKKKQGSQVGYWQAELREKGQDDPLSIEVIKFHFRQSMSSLELYYAEKPGEENVRNVSRPTTRKDLTIDSMEAVKAYYLWREEDNAQFATYLTDGLVGWAIDCWSTLSDELSLRPLFHRIVNSFSRVQM